MTCKNPFYRYIECSLKSWTNDTIDIKNANFPQDFKIIICHYDHSKS